MRLSPAAALRHAGNTATGERDAAYARLVYESGRAASEMGFWQFDRRHASRIDPEGIRSRS